MQAIELPAGDQQLADVGLHPGLRLIRPPSQIRLCPAAQAQAGQLQVRRRQSQLQLLTGPAPATGKRKPVVTQLQLAIGAQRLSARPGQRQPTRQRLTIEAAVVKLQVQRGGRRLRRPVQTGLHAELRRRHLPQPVGTQPPAVQLQVQRWRGTGLPVAGQR